MTEKYKKDEKMIEISEFDKIMEGFKDKGFQDLSYLLFNLQKTRLPQKIEARVIISQKLGYLKLNQNKGGLE